MVFIGLQFLGWFRRLHGPPLLGRIAGARYRMTQAFFVAARDGDIAALASLLANEVEIHTDGGGKVLAFRNIIRGLDRALRLFAGLRRKNATSPTLLHTSVIDGLPGYISIDRGLVQTTALDIRDGRIAAIYIVRNPDKLRHLGTPIQEHPAKNIARN